MQQPQNSQKYINIYTIAFAIIVTALASGYGTYSRQKSSQADAEKVFQLQVTDLQRQIDNEKVQRSYAMSENDALKASLLEKATTLSNSGYELINGSCRDRECLFDSKDNTYPVGITTVKGYYSTYFQEAFGEKKKCDALTLTNGSEKLINAIIKKVDQGIVIHRKNKDNQPIVNFDISKLSAKDKQKFLLSTEQNPVELVVFQPIVPNVGTGACFSMSDILEVK